MYLHSKIKILKKRPVVLKNLSVETQLLHLYPFFSSTKDIRLFITLLIKQL